MAAPPRTLDALTSSTLKHVRDEWWDEALADPLPENEKLSARNLGEVRASVTLDSAGETFSGSNTVTIADLEGTTVATRRGTIQGMRIVAEAPEMLDPAVLACALMLPVSVTIAPHA